MRTSTRKAKTTKKKTINNTTKKERGFDSLEVAPKEKSNTKGGEQLQRRLKNTRKSTEKLKTTRKNITKKKGGSIH